MSNNHLAAYLYKPSEIINGHQAACSSSRWCDAYLDRPYAQTQITRSRASPEESRRQRFLEYKLVTYSAAGSAKVGRVVTTSAVDRDSFECERTDRNAWNKSMKCPGWPSAKIIKRQAWRDSWECRNGTHHGDIKSWIAIGLGANKQIEVCTGTVCECQPTSQVGLLTVVRSTRRVKELFILALGASITLRRSAARRTWSVEQQKCCDI
jgi:hypothetical protein